MICKTYFSFLIFSITSIQIAFADPLACAKLFGSNKPTGTIFPGSVYVQIPTGVIPVKMDSNTAEVIQSTLDQMSLRFQVDIPLPDIRKARTQTLELDLDADGIDVSGANVYGQLSTKLNVIESQRQKPEPPQPKASENPSTGNAQIALHVDMLNAALSLAFKDLKRDPLLLSRKGIIFYVQEAPQILLNHTGVRTLKLQTKATISRRSMMLSRLAFKSDIDIQATVHADIQIAKDNSISVVIRNIDDTNFQMDLSDLRFSNAFMVGSLARSSARKVAGLLLQQMNHDLARSPMIFQQLIQVPTSVVGIQTQVSAVTMGTDGYLKIDLSMSAPKSETPRMRLQFIPK